MSIAEVVYEPDDIVRKGYLRIFPEILIELKESRWLTWQLFKRDFFAGYKQSFMGILWAFIVPFVSVGTFMVLNRAGVLAVGDIGVPYPLYSLLGVALWQLFSMGLIWGSEALVSAGTMLSQVNFSKKSLVLASFGRSLVSTLILFAFVGILFIGYGLAPSVKVLFLPLFLLPILSLSLGLAFFFSVLNVIVRDIANVLSILMTFVMFLTPVLYSRPASGALAAVTTYNPLYYLVAVPRDVLLTGSTSGWTGFLISCPGSIVALMAGLLIFHLTEKRIAERI